MTDSRSGQHSKGGEFTAPTKHHTSVRPLWGAWRVFVYNVFITGQIIDDTELDSDWAYVITDSLIRKFTNNGTWQQAEPIRGQGPSIPF